MNSTLRTDLAFATEQLKTAVEVHRWFLTAPGIDLKTYNKLAANMSYLIQGAVELHRNAEGGQTLEAVQMRKAIAPEWT